MTRANELTHSIVKLLNHTGYKAWRNYNGAVYSQKKETFLKNPQHKIGISDVIGFRKSDGIFLAIEVKIGRDKLSEEQTLFLDDVRKAGGIAFCVHDTITDFENKLRAALAELS